MVSIVIPYFNKDLTIDRAVDSVITQTYKNWELIIVDDQSILPLKMRDKWSNFNVKIVVNKNNLGPGPSRQKGMDLSKGDYLAFLDADDWWSPNFLKASIHALDNNKTVAASWVISNIYNKDGSVINRRYSELPFSNLQETSLQYPRPWQTGSLLWRRKYCGEWGELSTNQDYRFEFSSSLKNNSVVPVRELLYHVDQRLNNHRCNLIKSEIIFKNNFDLFKYVYESVKHSLSFKSRVLLFNRIIRAMIKIVENCDERDIKHYFILTEKMYSFTILFFRQVFILKLIHKLLQKSPFKLYF